MKEDDDRSAKEKPKTRALANPWQILGSKIWKQLDRWLPSFSTRDLQV